MNQQPEESVEHLESQVAQLLERIQAKKLSDQTLNHASSSSFNNVFPVELPQYPQHATRPDHRAAMARSKSTMGGHSIAGPAMSTGPDVSEHQAHKRQRRAYSQQSHAVQLSRSASNRSESATAMPFVQTGGPIAPLVAPSSTRLFPGNEFASPHLPSVSEHEVLPGVGMSPGDYLLATNVPYLETIRPNLSPDEAYANLSPSACPSMFSGSSAAEGTAPSLSRQSSLFDNYPSGNMMRVASSQSYAPDSFYGQEMLTPSMSQSYSTQSFSASKYPAPDQDLLGLAQSSPGTSCFPTTMPNMSLSPESTLMERTDSSSSSDSTGSTASRSEQRLKAASERVAKASKAPLAPKPEEPSAKAGTQEKMALSNRSSYQRPRHPKVPCPHCNDHPEGFRGDHELRRHVNAKHHGGLVKKFVCRDPATIGQQSEVHVRHPLSECKACVAGKEYGAYYNAAAHLRRTHFNPKGPRSKRGGDDEKRGGTGGGDWPSMAQLKMWFEEKMVQVDSNNSSSDDAEDNSQENLLDSPVEGYAEAADEVSPFDDGASFNLSYDEALNPIAFDTVDAAAVPPFYYGDAAQLNDDLGNFGFAASGTLGMGPSPVAQVGYQDVNQPIWNNL